LWQEVVIAAAAFAAGLINSVAGGGTLVSFPALVWTGRDAVLANTTSTVALWPASLAGVYGFRRELKGGARTALLFGAPSLAGGVLGAVLLLRTPSSVFARLGLLAFTDIHKMNAVKNLLAVSINGVAAAYFIASGKVYWTDVLVMTYAAIAGGYSGARLAYKLGRRFVRLAVIAIGLVMSVSLFFR